MVHGTTPNGHGYSEDAVCSNHAPRGSECDKVDFSELCGVVDCVMDVSIWEAGMAGPPVSTDTNDNNVEYPVCNTSISAYNKNHTVNDVVQNIIDDSVKLSGGHTTAGQRTGEIEGNNINNACLVSGVDTGFNPIPHQQLVAAEEITKGDSTTPETGSSNNTCTIGHYSDAATGYHPIPHQHTVVVEEKLKGENITPDITKPDLHHVAGETVEGGGERQWLEFSSCAEAGRLYSVTATDSGDNHHNFIVYDKCAQGTCDCTHTIGDAVAQLLPCRFFAECFLRGDNDPDWDYVMRGIIFGFRVINDSCDSAYAGRNYGSSTGELTHSAMSDKLKREINAGILTVRDNPQICSHPIGTVPKSDSIGFRTIIDCSAPKETCVNLFTDQCTTKFAYKSLDDVTDNMLQGEFMSVVDISDAYRAVNIHPSSACRQGLSWQFAKGVTTHLRDNRLCMGLSSSPFVFSKLSDFIVRCMVRRGHSRVTNYLDDFCTLSQTFEEGSAAQADLLALLRLLGFLISFKKLSSPNPVCRFLGIIIDSHKMNLSLPNDKLEKLLTCIRKLHGRKRATRMEIESLAGLVSHCAKVVRGGRTFARRIYDLCGSVKRSYYKIHLNQEFKADLEWWLRFASTFNGSANICPRHSESLCTYSDASQFGFAAFHAGDWLAGNWAGPSDVDKGEHSLGHHASTPFDDCYDSTGGLAHINALEFWPILCAANRWAHRWADRDIIMVTDNTTVMHALNSGKSKNKLIMQWLYDMFWLAVKFNFDISSVYIKSEANTICDSLSRLNEHDAKPRLKGAIGPNYMCCSQLFA